MTVHRRSRTLFLAAALLPLALLSPANTAAVDDASRKHDAPLAHALGALRGDDRVAVVVEASGDPGDAARGAGRVLRTLQIGWTYAHAFNGYSATLDVAELPALAARSDVARVHLDREVRATMDVSRRAVQADVANALGWTGAGVTVAVLDTGISALHPDLAGRIVGCVQFVGGVAAGACEDDNGHGTHVSGTIGGRGATYRGVAPDATFVAVKVLNAAGLGLTSDVIKGMDWIVANRATFTPPIRVMSASLGGSLGCEASDGTSADSRAADRVVDAGIVAVVSAGNSGPDPCTISSPGDARKVVTVGATDDRATVAIGDDSIAGFSSRGPTGDGRVKPEIVAPGVAITSAYLLGLYGTGSGTSMAAPHVSGLVALLLEKEPALAPVEVKARLTASATKLANDPGPTPNNDYGHGLARACPLLLAAC